MAFYEGGRGRQGLSEAKEDFLRADRTGSSAPRWKQISRGQAELALLFLGYGALPGGWQCWTAVPQECNTLLRVGAASWAAENPKGSSPDQVNWKDCLRMEADVAQSDRACSSFSGLWGLLQGAGGAGQLFHRSTATSQGGSG